MVRSAAGMMLVINFLFPEGLETSVFLAGVGRFRRRDGWNLTPAVRGKKRAVWSEVRRV
jgi:hypothetical protein